MSNDAGILILGALALWYISQKPKGTNGFGFILDLGEGQIDDRTITRNLSAIASGTRKARSMRARSGSGFAPTTNGGTLLGTPSVPTATGYTPKTITRTLSRISSRTRKTRALTGKAPTDTTIQASSKLTEAQAMRRNRRRGVM